MSWILIPAIFESVFLATLVLVKKHKSRADYFLISLLLLYGLTILATWLEFYNQEHGYPFPVFLNLSPLLLFLHGPFLWLYIKALTAPAFRFRLWHLMHLIPFLLGWAGMYITVYSLPLEEHIRMINTGEFREGFIYPAILAGIFLVNQAYFIWGLLLIRKYRNSLKDYYSRLENIDLGWLTFLLISALIAYGVNSFLFIADYFLELLPLESLMLITYIIGSVFILVLGFYGQKQTNVFKEAPGVSASEANPPESANQQLQKAEEAFIGKLMNYMDEEEPYLQAELTINKLAAQLHVTPGYLSGILNRYLYKNFFDFVNSYRVEAFKRKARDDSYRNFTLISIAYDCGFNSKATFNRVFKNFTGTTPGAYYRGVSEK